MTGKLDVNRKTVLLAEDEEPIRALVFKLLQRSGYHVIICGDGQEALQKAWQFKGVIDLIISDIDMPHMNGIELATQLQIERPDIKVLLMSGTGEELMPFHADWQFLPKPFKFDVLKGSIQRLLQNANHGPAMADSRPRISVCAQPQNTFGPEYHFRFGPPL